MATPLAIWGGSVIMAAAIYFRPSAGEVAGGPVQPMRGSDHTGELSAAASGSPRVEPRDSDSGRGEPAALPPRQLSLEAERERDEAAVKAAISAAHPAWSAKCWQPVVAAHPEARGGAVSAGVTFDAQGKQMGWAVSAARREEPSGELAACLQRLPMALTIPAPGRSVHFQLPLAFP